METVHNDEVIMQCRSITKTFGPVVALDNVDLTVKRGEVRGLIGENGSGKSTVTSIFSGMQPADSGEMFYKGEPWRPESMFWAAAHGVGMIVQETGTVPEITVAENMFLCRTGQFAVFGGKNGKRWGPISNRAMVRVAQQALDDIGAGHIRANAMTYTLDMQDRKLAEVMAEDGPGNYAYNAAVVSDALKRFIGQNGASPVYLLLILGAALLFMIVVFGYTRFGYDYRALQSGQKIAVNTGANEYLNCMLCYMISGAMAGLAGFFFGAQLQYTRVSSYLNFGTVSRMFDAFCPLFFAGLVGRYCNKHIAIVISVAAYEFLQVAFGNMNAVNTTFTSNIYGIINSVILVVFLIYLNNENKIIELVTLKKYLAEKREKAAEKS